MRLSPSRASLLLLVVIFAANRHSGLPSLFPLALRFVPPSASPTQQSSTYTGKSNSTLPKSPVVAGKSFDRFIQLVMENTNFATSASSPVFQNLSSQGILMNGYYGVTHVRYFASQVLRRHGNVLNSFPCAAVRA